MGQIVVFGFRFPMCCQISALGLIFAIISEFWGILKFYLYVQISSVCSDFEWNIRSHLWGLILAVVLEFLGVYSNFTCMLRFRVNVQTWVVHSNFVYMLWSRLYVQILSVCSNVVCMFRFWPKQYVQRCGVVEDSVRLSRVRGTWTLHTWTWIRAGSRHMESVRIISLLQSD